MNARYDPYAEALVDEGKARPRDIELALWRQEIRGAASRESATRQAATRRRFRWAFGRLGWLGRFLLATLKRHSRATSVVD